MSRFLLTDSDSSPLAAAIRQAIGAAPDEPVEVMTPEFNRPRSWTPAMLPPTDARSWSGFTAADAETLYAWGCRPWNAFTTERPSGQRVGHKEAWFYDVDAVRELVGHAESTHELWLFPAEWYDSIPNGFPIVDINGCIEQFERGKTDDDRRFGLLAYGVVVSVPEPKEPKA